MARLKPQALTPTLERAVAAQAHWWACDALSRSTALGLDSLVFQGGTCLSLAWSSPRFSEDLDFLLAKEAAATLEARMEGVGRHVEKGLQLAHPGAKVSVKGRVRDDNPNAMFRLTIELPGILGNVMVKMEFWRVPAEQIQPYLRTHTSLHQTGQTAVMAGVARPEQIAADKIIALAHRDRLKWRDLFDMWFLRGHHPEVNRLLHDAPRLAEQLAQVGKLYDKTPEQTAAGLDAFLALPVSEMVGRAQQGLQPWLEPSQWANLWPTTVTEMVHQARESAQQALDALRPPTLRPTGLRR